MKLTTGQSCLVLVILAFILAGAQALAQSPGGIALLIVLVGGLGVAILMFVRARTQNRYKNLLAQADQLEKIANGDFGVENMMFSTQKDEVIVLHLNKVTLQEYKSTGSTYSGGYGGLSFRVTKGVRANVGGMQGQTTRNPEERTPLDVGSVTFTNQRFVFAGPNLVREWDLDKIVNLSPDANGINLEIAVSNREKASVLSALNYPDPTPGMAASIAVAWKEKGKAGAMADAKDMAEGLRKAVAEAQAK